jgi:hypothetical protein
MTKQQFEKVLSNPSYKELCEIYKAHGKDAKKAAFLAQVADAQPGSIHFNMVLKEVKDIFRIMKNNNAFTAEAFHVAPAPVIKIEQKDILPPVKSRPIIDHNPHVNRADLPEHLQKAFDDNGKMESENKTMFAEMKVAKTNDERKRLLNAICENEETQSANWAAIDTWWEHKDDKPQEPEKKKYLSPADIASKIEAAKNYIRRYSDSKNAKQLEKVEREKKFLKDNGVKWTLKPKK